MKKVLKFRKGILTAVFFVAIFFLLCLRFDNIKAKIANAEWVWTTGVCSGCGQFSPSGAVRLSTKPGANLIYQTTNSGITGRTVLVTTPGSYYLTSVDLFNNSYPNRDILEANGYQAGFSSVRFTGGGRTFTMNPEFNNSIRMNSGLVPYFSFVGAIMDDEQMVVVNKTGEYIRTYGANIGEKYPATNVGQLVSSYTPGAKKLFLVRPTATTITIQEEDGSKYEFNQIGQLYRLMAYVDLLGNKTVYNRNTQGNLVTIVDPFGNILYKAIYGENGTLSSAISATGEITTFVTDAYNRVATINQPDGRQDKFSYVSVSDNSNVNYLALVLEYSPYTGGKRAFTYFQDLLLSKDETNDYSVTYDYGSDYIKTTDAKKQVAGLKFVTTGCVANHICTQTFDVPEAPESQMRERQLSTAIYGLYGKYYLLDEETTSQIVNGDTSTSKNRIVNTYNANGFLSKIENFNGSGTLTDSTTYDYNANNDVINSTNTVYPGARSLATTYTYSQLPVSVINSAIKINGILKTTYPDGQTEENVYATTASLGGRGILPTSQKLNGNITKKYVYDTIGRIKTDTDVVGTKEFTTTYNWNTNGTLKDVTDGQSNIRSYAYASENPLYLLQVRDNGVLVTDYAREYDNATKYIKTFTAKSRATDLAGIKSTTGIRNESYLTTDDNGEKVTATNGLFKQFNVFAKEPTINKVSLVSLLKSYTTDTPFILKYGRAVQKGMYFCLSCGFVWIPLQSPDLPCPYPNLTPTPNDVPQNTLTIIKPTSNTGTGNIKSDIEPKIDCGDTCQNKYPQKSEIVLAASASIDSEFTSATCTASSGTPVACRVFGSTITVNLTEDIIVFPVFTKKEVVTPPITPPVTPPVTPPITPPVTPPTTTYGQLTVDTSGNGFGYIYGPGINCGIPNPSGNGFSCGPVDVPLGSIGITASQLSGGYLESWTIIPPVTTCVTLNCIIPVAPGQSVLAIAKFVQNVPPVTPPITPPITATPTP